MNSPHLSRSSQHGQAPAPQAAIQQTAQQAVRETGAEALPAPICSNSIVQNSSELPAQVLADVSIDCLSTAEPRVKAASLRNFFSMHISAREFRHYHYLQERLAKQTANREFSEVHHFWFRAAKTYANTKAAQTSKRNHIRECANKYYIRNKGLLTVAVKCGDKNALAIYQQIAFILSLPVEDIPTIEPMAYSNANICSPNTEAAASLSSNSAHSFLTDASSLMHPSSIDTS